MITKPKGTYDIIGKDALIFQFYNDICENYAKLYNFSYVRTPIFENSDLYHRSVGETSDIVTKETYDFKDRSERSMTLRPEGTAGVVRCLIENKLYGNRNDAIKLYYNGTMYRYERPQAGRNREFTQFGVEMFNSNDPLSDAEIISLGYNILQELGMESVVVNVNSLGDKESRQNYTKALVDYLTPKISELCEDCQKRLKTNPLRILDCKYDQNNEILKNVPKMTDYLNEKSQKRFKEVLNNLDILEVDYLVNPNIVRGLDYYDHTVFEFVLEDKGITLGAGGRYNSLINELGGPEIPAVGFALGNERIINELKENSSFSELPEDYTGNVDVYIMSLNEEEKLNALKISQNLRLNGISCEINSNNLSMKSQFKLADKLNAKQLIILNSDDLQKGLINIKDNATKEEQKIDEDEIAEYLIGIL